MDFGPFGFMEAYDRNWSSWVGGGEHFNFKNQHIAAGKNFESLAHSVALLLDVEGQAQIENDIIPSYYRIAEECLNDVFRQKLGLSHWSAESAALWADMEALMERTEADYTMFWRQLSSFPERVIPLMDGSRSSADLVAQYIGELFVDIFYRPLADSDRELWTALLVRWVSLIKEEISASDANTTPEAVSAAMRTVNPKFVPREWMLEAAYGSAEKGEYSITRRLFALFERPYEEHSQEDTEDFYKRGRTNACVT